MRILVLSSEIGESAPGIVFERLIEGLSAIHDVEIITASFKPMKKLNSSVKATEIKSRVLPTRIQKALFAFFGFNPLDVTWSKKAVKLVKQKQKKYDLVLSFISFNNYCALKSGTRIARLLNMKQYVYSVDAIPAPLGWMENDSFFRKTKKFIGKSLSEVDGLFLANEKMLDYQLKTFRPSEKLITGVIYNPSYGKLTKLECTGGNTSTFLYTGGIYGPRKIIYVLQAFVRVLKEFPDSTLEFVGSNIEEHQLAFLTPSQRDKVIVHPFAKDLTAFYARSTALLDIDAELDDDVFLSSKITNYITINRTIISETGPNSPSRTIFKGIPSVIQCGHDQEMLFNAMKKAILEKDTMQFDDRADAIALFDLKTVTEKLNKFISR